MSSSIRINFVASPRAINGANLIEMVKRLGKIVEDLGNHCLWIEEHLYKICAFFPAEPIKN